MPAGEAPGLTALPADPGDQPLDPGVDLRSRPEADRLAHLDAEHPVAHLVDVLDRVLRSVGEDLFAVLVTEDGPLALPEVESFLERLTEDGLPVGDIQAVDVVAHGALDLQTMQAGLHQEAAFAEGAEAAHSLQVFGVGEPGRKTSSGSGKSWYPGFGRKGVRVHTHSVHDRALF